jgi:TPP-dependent pyruvate/acetoin dehydrogenase alpha subunit
MAKKLREVLSKLDPEPVTPGRFVRSVRKNFGITLKELEELTSIKEDDCLVQFTNLLLKNDILSEKKVSSLRAEFEEEARLAQEKVRGEPVPTPESVWDHFYANGENGDWRKF